MPCERAKATDSPSISQEANIDEIGRGSASVADDVLQGGERL
jgi:hypothetical protein